MSLESMIPEQEAPKATSFDKLLSKPFPQGEIRIDSPEDEARLIVLTNGLQARLAERHGEAFLEWKKKYSEKFRDAFHEAVQADPRFFDGYATVRDIPDDKIDEIGSRLYKLAA